MEVARHLINTYFKDTTNPMTRHQLDSYNYFLKTKIPNFIRDFNQDSKSAIIIKLDREEERKISIFIGGKDGSKIKYVPSSDESGVILPHFCRLNNRTYAVDLRADIVVEYTIGTEVITQTFSDILIAKFPLMLKSSLCYLSDMTSEQLYEAGECKFELGGYFIIGGSEKVLLTQESQGANMFYSSKRKVQSREQSLLTSRTEVGESVGKVEGATKEEPFEFIAAVRSVNESGTKGPFSHFLIIPPKNMKPDDPDKISKASDYADFTTKRLAEITLPGFQNPVPLFSVFKALGITNHRDIYNIILFGISDEQKLMYDEMFAELIITHEKEVAKQLDAEENKEQDADMLVLKKQTRVGTQSAVYMNLYNDMFPHCEKYSADETAASFYKRKAYLLGMMTKIAMDVALDINPKTDREHYRFKRLEASGELMFTEFKRIYRDVMKLMTRRLDERVFYERENYSGRKIANVIRQGAVHEFWKSNIFSTEFEKSFKGLWNKTAGVSQELMRFSYLGSIAHLRRVNVDTDKDTKVLDIRRIHGSSWGLLCPCDNPDGREVGLIKSLSLFSQLSTSFPSEILRKLVFAFKYFIPLTKINPASWNPAWTKVTLNSDILGAFTEKTDDFHYEILEKRRARQIQKDVSLRWDRFYNEYIISTDSGRPIRPIYREGVTEEKVKRIKDWAKMDTDVIDYVDAEETESLMLSMTPFSPDKRSEIHGSLLFSASASVGPNFDFNTVVRDFFSCQQLKQAASWYNTAFNKRYDTLATWLNYAQQPLSQTWTYRHVNGGNGCIGYGENPIVALGIYSGYNQEDSIILNETSLKRGMFNTTYYHSYDFSEEMINFTEQTHTDFANVSTNAKYRETVIRKQDVIYDYLDDDGVIKVGSPVTDKTALVGMVSAIRDKKTLQITGYNDITKVPKRAQHGIVESVYRFTTPDNLQGVKIRIAEHRAPVVGDKFSARHGQKGTCGFSIPEEDMPFTANGLRPDMIVNPHAFPSRMTIGQFIETMSTKLGIHLGKIVDCTAFSTSNRIPEVKDSLLKSGFHPYGHELMYNGQSGEMMEAEIFMGPTYYIRSKLMVDDKINYRSTGGKTLLTHQPTEGRADGGGLRIGEMERDILIAHGMSKFINESSLERSDKTRIQFQPELGYFESRDSLVSTSMRTSYALGLFLRELESMHVSTHLASPF